MKILLGISLLFLVSCGAKLTGGIGAKNGAPNSNGGGTINGSSAEYFYGQMSYQKNSTGASGPSHYLAPAEGTQRIVQRLMGGVNVYEDPALFLWKSGHQFTLVSNLSLGCDNGHGIIKKPIDHRVLNGTWSVDSTSHINLSGIAWGTGGTFGTMLAVSLTFLNDIHAAVHPTNLVGSAAQLIYRQMPSSVDDISAPIVKDDYQNAYNSLRVSGVCKTMIKPGELE